MTVRYTVKPEEARAALDREDAPFFMFGISAGAFQVWAAYREGMITRDEAIDRLTTGRGWRLS
jgi:hypothetical protein